VVFDKIWIVDKIKSIIVLIYKSVEMTSFSIFLIGYHLDSDFSSFIEMFLSLVKKLSQCFESSRSCFRSSLGEGYGESLICLIIDFFCLRLEISLSCF